MFIFLFFQNLRQLKRYFSKNLFPRILTAWLFFMILGAVFFGLYRFFLKAFLYISVDKFFGEAMLMYLMQMFFLIISGLGFAGSLITFWLWLFRGNRQQWIVTSPNFKTLPWMVFTQVLFSNLWPLFLVVLPMLFAMHKTFEVKFWFLFLGFLNSGVLLALVTALAGVLTMCICYLLYFLRKQWLNLNSLAVILAGILVFFGGLAYRSLANLNLKKILQAENLEILKALPNLVSEKFNLMPSHFLADSFWFVVFKNHKQVLNASVMQLVIFLSILFVLYLSFSKFLKIWQHMQEQAQTSVRSSSPLSLIFRAKNSVQALIGKEAVLSLRHKKNFLWLVFMFLIWLLQAGLSHGVAKNLAENLDILPKLPAQMYAFQISLVVFFITSVALRFAFPSFSSEGKTIWLIGSLPFSLKKMFWSKLGFFVPLLTGLGILISAVNANILGISLFKSSLFLSLIAVASAFIATFALALGAKFANFSTDDPQVLSTSLPGLFFTFGSFAYGSLGAWAFYRYLLPNSEFWQLVLFFWVSLFLSILLIRLAVVSFKNREYILSNN